MRPFLDDLDRISKIDSSDMLGAVDNFPDPMVNREAGFTSHIKLARSSFDSLCFMGMGGSASAGDVVLDWLRPRLQVPAFVHREPSLPSFVNSKTLFIAVSYSGNTSETLAAFRAAKKRGSSLVGIGTGGKLKELCALFKVPFVGVESSVAPRAALTQLMVGVASTLEAVGVSRSISRELDESAKELIVLRKQLRVEVPSRKNRAKQMASRLLERFVVIYSLQRMSSVARRFKNQLAENAKQVAKFDLLPEACHNEVEAWHELDKGMIPVLIRDQAETSFERSAFQAFKSTLSTTNKTKSVEVSSNTRQGLSELLYPILFLDYVTVYLAILKGVDPTPTRFIEMYKARLRN